MKSGLSKIIFCFFLLFSQESTAVNISEKYIVSSSGIKIGDFDWSIVINDDFYESNIYLKSSGLLSRLYKFEGRYMSEGIVSGTRFKPSNYEQFWKTNKKNKSIMMSFDGNLKYLTQEPKEVEYSRVNLNNLSMYSDPITSFINILYGHNNVNTIDGRRIYTMRKIAGLDESRITVEIDKYKNIWTDHKRNDLKKIEFVISGDNILPEKINIFFKNYIFKLKKN